jgi:hypothetical protein
VFDNVMSGKNLDEAHAECSFSDPSIALDGGYVQVTRLNGHGPALVVVPDGKTPFEAYNPIAGAQGLGRKAGLFEDLTPRNMTFEGFYEWMVASAAYQQNEWKNVEEWNPATMIVLKPGEERTVGCASWWRIPFVLSRKRLPRTSGPWPSASLAIFCPWILRPVCS